MLMKLGFSSHPLRRIRNSQVLSADVVPKKFPVQANTMVPENEASG